MVFAGLAMALGMANAYGPIVAVAVAGVILSIGHWRTTRAGDAHARKPVS